MKRVTIKDIARLAGVSRGTVDRVINNRGNVSKKVEEKVMTIAKELGYRKNILASRLASTKVCKIAIVSPDESSDVFWEIPKRGMEKAIDTIKDFGIYINYFNFDLLDKNEFKSQFKKAIDSNPDIIVLAPVFWNESMKLTDYAWKKDVPIITFNSEINYDNIISYIGQDSYKSGYLVGRLIDIKMNDNDEIVVINLAHKATNAPHYSSKFAGLSDYFKDKNYKDAKIFLYDFKDFMNETKLKSFFDKVKKNHPALKVLFFTNSRAYRLLNIMNENEIENYVIIGFDTIPQNVKLLKENKIDFLIHQNPFQQGYKSIMNSVDYLIHKKEIQPKQYLPLDIVVKENVDFYLDESIL